MNTTFRFRLVINRIEANDMLQEDVQLWMRLRVLRDFKQWPKDVVNQLLKVIDRIRFFVNAVQTWHLDEPAYIGGKKVVVTDPRGNLVPLTRRSSGEQMCT